MINLQETIILISNHYSSFCNLYSCYHEINEELALSYDIGKTIINKIFNNAKQQNFVPKIYLIGGDVIHYWETITKPLIEYCLSLKQYCEIYLQFENENNRYEEIFKYLKEHNIYLNFIYNLNTSFYLEAAIKYKPFLKLYYYINNDNVNDLFINYQHFNTLNIRKLKFTIEFDINKKILENNLYQIKNFIIQSFINNEVVLIPDNINNNFIKVLMLDEEKRIGLQLLHHSELTTYHCPMTIGQRIIINQLGQLFCCHHEKLDVNNPMYIGDIFNSDFETVDIFQKVYHFTAEDKKPYILNPQNEKAECKSCKIYTICHLNCFANNLLISNDPSLCSSKICRIDQLWFDISLSIIDTLDQNQNELFKNYFYAQCMKGLEEAI